MLLVILSWLYLCSDLIFAEKYYPIQLVLFSFQLICTITPASSSMEETHNTLKFASRAKRIEIYASQNKVCYDITFWFVCGMLIYTFRSHLYGFETPFLQIIDEKSLIKKYQREISALKLELDQLRRGMLVGVNPEEIMSLKQKVQFLFLFLFLLSITGGMWLWFIMASWLVAFPYYDYPNCEFYSKFIIYYLYTS